MEGPEAPSPARWKVQALVALSETLASHLCQQPQPKHGLKGCQPHRADGRRDALLSCRSRFGDAIVPFNTHFIFRK